MALHLVTGHAGSEHVTAADAAAFNAAMFGGGSYVLDSGNKFGVSVIGSNQLRISSGEAMFQGRHIRLGAGEIEDITIENGTQGMNRNDLIVIRYTKNSGTGVESANLVVIKGTPSASTASDPAYMNANIDSGATTADMPLYRVPLNGFTLGTPVAIFSVKNQLPAIFSGTSTPAASLGEDGDIYIQY